jgi:hypothetical protein
MNQHDEAAEPMEGALTPDEVTELQASLTPRLVDLLSKLLPDSSSVLAEYGGHNPDPFDDPGQFAMSDEGQQAAADTADMPMPGGGAPDAMRPPVSVPASAAAMQPPAMPMPGAMPPQAMPPAPQTGLNRVRMGVR